MPALLKSLAEYKGTHAQGEIPQSSQDKEQLPGSGEINGDCRTHTASGAPVFRDWRF